MNFLSFAAETNDHQLSGLKQHKYIILEFYRSENENGSAELGFACRFWRRIYFLPLPALEDSRVP